MNALGQQKEMPVANRRYNSDACSIVISKKKCFGTAPLKSNSLLKFYKKKYEKKKT